MTFKLKSMPFAVACAVSALSVAAMAPAMAQTAAEPAVQRVVVTGSLISRASAETATPVQVLTAADIQKSGKTSVAELLTDLASNGAGTLGTGFSGAFANGASGVSLRGLTVGAPWSCSMVTAWRLTRWAMTHSVPSSTYRTFRSTPSKASRS